MFYLAKCPPGFTSEDGMTNCRACGKNKYWVNATNCEDCPAGSKTDVRNGVPDIQGCKGMVFKNTFKNQSWLNCTRYFRENLKVAICEFVIDVVSTTKSTCHLSKQIRSFDVLFT